MYRFRILNKVILTLTLFSAFSFANDKTFAILPFASYNQSTDFLYLFASSLRTECTKKSLQVTDGFGVDTLLKQSGCDTKEQFNNPSCAILAAQKQGADHAVTGTINTVGTMVFCMVTIYPTGSAQPYWTQNYEMKGPIEKAFKYFPERIAEDLYTKENPAPDTLTVFEPQEDEIIGTQHRTDRIEESGAEKTAVQPIPAKDTSRKNKECITIKNWNGIVSHPAGGISFLSVLGEARESQTQISGWAHMVMPISRKAQLRFRAAIPTSSKKERAAQISGSIDSVSDKWPDPFLSAEIERGWPYFSIAGGLVYQYFSAFTIEGQDNYYSYSPSSSTQATATYETSHAMHMTLGIRGGKPTAGFLGRFTWPLPYIMYDSNPDNYILEWSAMGVFGNEKFRGGIGIWGFFKNREADYIIERNGTRHNYPGNSSDDYYFDNDEYYQFDELTTITEQYVLIPGFRGAFLVTPQIVVGFHFELGGTIFPFESTYNPLADLDMTFGFGKLPAPVIFDGKF